jgi:hypothetical protein
MSSRLLTVAFTMLFTGTLIAVVQAGSTGERPLAKAEMAVLYGGDTFEELCCFDIGLCDATFPKIPCTQQGQGACQGRDTEWGNNFNCFGLGIPGEVCVETEPPVLCLSHKTCHLDYLTNTCMETDDLATVKTNTPCSDNCLW